MQEKMRKRIKILEIKNNKAFKDVENNYKKTLNLLKIKSNKMPLKRSL